MHSCFFSGNVTAIVQITAELMPTISPTKLVIVNIHILSEFSERQAFDQMNKLHKIIIRKNPWAAISSHSSKSFIGDLSHKTTKSSPKNLS